jgi:hypothetical protein
MAPEKLSAKMRGVIADRAIDQCTWHRLRRWLRAKHKVSSTGTTRCPREFFHDVLGLVWLLHCERNVPSATA